MNKIILSSKLSKIFINISPIVNDIFRYILQVNKELD
jgi:hypothetical protein